MYLLLFVYHRSLYLICNHEMCPWSMYCCSACLGCPDCSGMCACLPALCCWRWVVWCMHVWCVDSDVHSCFELWSALSQSSWIRRYIRVTYYYYLLKADNWISFLRINRVLLYCIRLLLLSFLLLLRVLLLVVVVVCCFFFVFFFLHFFHFFIFFHFSFFFSPFHPRIFLIFFIVVVVVVVVPKLEPISGQCSFKWPVEPCEQCSTGSCGTAASQQR